MRYGIKRNTCGVYLIENKFTGEKYVGASIDVGGRLSTHFGRDAKKYPWRKFYKDILELGREGFNWKLLEECERENLLEREQFWYDKLQPSYNYDRPVKFPCESKKTMVLAHTSERYKKSIEVKRERYKSKEYRKLFRDIQKKRFCPVDVFTKTGEKIKSFENYSDCAKWLNEVTTFKGKNKVSKIRDVCNGIRPSAFGYVFRHSKTCNDYSERK